MSRYLTPSKVGLLVLISLYTDSMVTSDGIIPVLSFVTSRTVPRSVADCDGHVPATSPSLSLDIADFDLILKGLESTIPGRTLQDKFLEKLWLIDSLHSMHEFFRNLKNIVAQIGPPAQQANPTRGKILLARTSPLGIFVRRAQLEFTRLQFDDTVKLWTNFMRFRQPSEESWRKRNSMAPTLSFDDNFSDLQVDPHGKLVAAIYPGFGNDETSELELSTEEMERLLEFQIDKLQKLGNRLPTDVRESCERMLSRSAAVPSLAYFVKFFDSWRAGDYTTAFESLHRYFDYTMHTRDRSFYQYALLHMAILQADFGCFSEAVAAIKETISTARENHDTNCLNFSLSWLNNLSRTYPREVKKAGYTMPSGSERDGLTYLKSKAKEMKMPNLLSSVLLSEAKWLLATGDSVPQAFERTYQSTHLNAMYGFQNMFGVQSLVFVSLYGRLGYNQMAESYCEILLDCFRHCTPVDEVLRASCRMAYTAIQSGQYQQANTIFESLQPLVHRNLRGQQYLTIYAAIMKLKHSLRRHDLTAASYLLDQLSGAISGLTIDPDLGFQITLLKIDYLERLGSFEMAYNEIEDLAEQLQADDADIYQRIHVMVVKALLYSKLGKAEKGFTVAMRAASAAWNARILPALWESWGAISNILGALGEYDAQRKILEGIIPQALGCGDYSLCAQLYSWQADACMGLAGKEEADSISRLNLVSKAESFLDRASIYYKKIEDIQGECDMISKKSAIAKVRGDDQLAEDWARRYLALYDRHIKTLYDSDEEV